MTTSLHLFANTSLARLGLIAKPATPAPLNANRAWIKSPAHRLFSIFIPCLLLLLAAAINGTAQATESAMASFTDVSLGGGEFDYTITLDNTGTTTIGTFWYAWVPGEDFMAVSPTNIVSPSNWVAAITGGGGGDGYAIQWKASSAPSDLAAGDFLQFSFESTSTPAELDGDSTFYPTTPVGTTFVYTGAPFSDAGYQFLVQSAPVPEPSLSSLAILGLLGLISTRSRLLRTRFISRRLQVPR